MVSIDVLILPVNSRIEVDEWVETHMGEEVDLMSSTIPNRSLFEKREECLNNLRP